MTAATSPATTAAFLITPFEVAVLRIKRLLYVYFLLWVLEGALRKWFLPQLSDALLLSRDPLLLVTYGIAATHGLFPRNKTLFAAAVIGVLSAFAGFLVLPEGPLVVLFGVRTNFLYLPLIYLIPKVWNRSDVERLGNLALWMSLPMAALTVAQFLAAPEAFINVGAGAAIGGQLGTARGHIRPSGTFSFVLGPACFFALTTAFTLNGLLSSSKNKPRPWLVAGAALAFIAATVASGSRGQLVGVALVGVIGTAVVATLNQRLFVRWVGAALVLSIALLGAAQFSFFAEGTSTLTERLQGGQTSMGAGVQTGLVVRVANNFTAAFDKWGETPPFGVGLGLGTIVGGRLANGVVGWTMDSEEDWSRVILESGPLLGGAFLLLRVFITLSLFAFAIPATKQHKNALPALLAAAAGPTMLTGQWGQTTVLGFAVFTAGLVLAATRNETAQTNPQASAAVTGEIFPPLRGNAAAPPRLGTI